MTTLLKHLTALAAAATMMLAVSAPAHAQLGDLKFGSYKVTSVVPTSFTSLDGTVAISVTNPVSKINITGISGVVYKGDVPFLIGSADDVVIPSGTTELSVTGHAALESVSSLFALVRNPTIDPAAYTIDVKADIRIRGRKYPVEKKGIPLSRILKR